MFNWSAFTLLLYIAMRMSGLVLFNPIFARSGVPALFRGGFVLLLSLTTYSVYSRQSVAVPDTTIELALRLLLELGMGFLLSLCIHFFFYIAEAAGDVVDTQMGMSMARSYDPGTRSSATMTSNLLNVMMLLLFFSLNGHLTLLRIIMTSGELVPFGSAAFGFRVAERVLELFAECVLLGLKVSLPILGAELLGQMGMGVLMKAIPQINIFAINIELKVIVGMLMLIILLSPISEYLAEVEMEMLRSLRDLAALSGGV